MAFLSISAAARAAGVDRSTIRRAVKSGRLSTTTNAFGQRGIDTSELLRTFGPLQGDGEVQFEKDPQPPMSDTPNPLVEILREQLWHAQEQLRHAQVHAQERENQLFALLRDAQCILADEQQVRRDLEQKLLLAPRPAPGGNSRVWVRVLAILLLVALAGLVVILAWPELASGLLHKF
jgi:hypothetical protein